VRVEEENWKIVGVYMGSGIQRTLQDLERWGEDKEEGRRTLIGGDFNGSQK